VLVFGWLEFKDIPVGEIVGNVSGDLMVKIALSIYYLSWVAGTINDVDEQETAYAEAPNKGKFPRKGFIVAVGVAAVFALLCCVTSAKTFSVILAAFLAANVVGYLYVLAVVRPVKEASENRYSQDRDHQSLARLGIVWTYMGGTWQWYRFAYGFAAIGIVMAMSFSRFPQWLNALYSPIPAETYMALSVLFYVLTFEGWIWSMRVWAKVAQWAVDYVMDVSAAIEAGQQVTLSRRRKRKKGGAR
jgi:hypothetical protein